MTRLNLLTDWQSGAVTSASLPSQLSVHHVGALAGMSICTSVIPWKISLPLESLLVHSFFASSNLHSGHPYNTVDLPSFPFLAWQNFFLVGRDFGASPLSFSAL